jgi:hypothetical protein
MALNEVNISCLGLCISKHNALLKNFINHANCMYNLLIEKLSMCGSNIEVGKLNDFDVMF